MTKRIVLGVTDPRSAVRLLRGLPERLVSDGWQVHLVTGGAIQTDVYEASLVNVHRIEMTREPNIAADFQALRAWRSLLKSLKPQVVMVGTPKAGFLGVVAAWLTGVPNRVYQLRGLRLEAASGLRRKLLTVLEKVTCGLATKVLPVSQSLLKLVLDLGIVRPHKVSLIGSGSSNGVDIERFVPNQAQLHEKLSLPLEPGIPVIGFVGRITPDKGSRELIEASKILEAKGIQHQLLVVGREDSRDELIRFRNRSLQRTPIFTGDVPDTAPYYQVMDVLCLPTYREGFPNVVLEASASGIPTVTTDATGAVDSVVDGLTGKIVSKGSAEELASALHELLVDHETRSALGRNARDYVSKNYDRSRVQRDVVTFLNGLLDISGPNKSPR